MSIIEIVRLVLFLILSVLLLVFTLRRPHAHRGYRFLAFECILALIFLQSDMWFVEPLRPVQILSWIFLAGSIFLALHGFLLLSRQGLPDQDLENTTQLVTTGAYRFIRHPLYASLILFGTGAALKRCSILSLALLAALMLAVYATARVEERTNLERFGERYAAYMRRSKRFVPFIF
ncbi:MAG: isoprenylcysteine carboxylmethyltransferase family protein [Anaerolineales bacterium]|nr:MAG: isoprenylcysteine carboxylmethyltransferase family protein [Anaerolineales bacterium]